MRNKFLPPSVYNKPLKKDAFEECGSKNAFVSYEKRKTKRILGRQNKNVGSKISLSIHLSESFEKDRLPRASGVPTFD